MGMFETMLALKDFDPEALMNKITEMAEGHLSAVHEKLNHLADDVADMREVVDKMAGAPASDMAVQIASIGEDVGKVLLVLQDVAKAVPPVVAKVAAKAAPADTSKS